MKLLACSILTAKNRISLMRSIKNFLKKLFHSSILIKANTVLYSDEMFATNARTLVKPAQVGVVDLLKFLLYKYRLHSKQIVCLYPEVHHHLVLQNVMFVHSIFCSTHGMMQYLFQAK